MTQKSGSTMPLLDALKALSDRNRLKLLTMLLSGDLCVGALANHLGISKPAVSQHLGILRRAGLVRGEKRGYWTHYVVDRQALEQVAAELRTLSTAGRHRRTVCWRIHQTRTDQPPSKEIEMCQNGCQQPEKLKDRPETCTLEQIHACHGDSNEHPCKKDDSDSQKT